MTARSEAMRESQKRKANATDQARQQPPSAPRKKPKVTKKKPAKATTPKAKPPKAQSRKPPAPKPRKPLQALSGNVPLPYSQLAANVQSSALFIGEDEDIQDEDVDPAPEEVEEEFNEDNISFICRWRAHIGKDPYFPAFDSEELKLGIFSSYRVWEWVDSTIQGLLPQKAVVRSLLATIYYEKQAKAEQLVHALSRDKLSTFMKIGELIKRLHRTYPGKIYHLDVDLILAIEQPPQPQSQVLSSQASRSRPRIATQIQEDGLAEVLAGEVGTTGEQLGIMDYWQCRDRICENFKYTCFINRAGGLPDRFENHFPVNSNILRLWHREVTRGDSSVKKPSDNVRFALMKHRDELREKKAAGGSLKAGEEPSFAELSRLYIATQMQQMQQLLRTQNPQASTQNHALIPELPLSPLQASMDQERDFRNFFNWWTQNQQHAEPGGIRRISERLAYDGWDLNTILHEEGLTMKVWTEHYEGSPAALQSLKIKLRQWVRLYKKGELE